MRKIQYILIEGGERMVLFMEDKRFAVATEKANEIIETMNLYEPNPLSTSELVTIVGEKTNTVITVKETDFSEIIDDCDYGAMMSVTKKGDKQFALIILNSNDKIDNKFRRFSLVHELGHLMTGRYNIADSDDFTLSTHIDYKFSKIQEEDYESNDFLLNEEIANVFALKVLLPYKAFVKYLNDADFNLKKVAERFGVHESAIESRFALGF